MPEVENMMDIDYTQEKLIEYERMEAREEALKEGKAEGKAEGILSLLSKGKITDEDAAEELDITIEELAKLKSEN
jgi:predicted transposase YdaD